VDGCEDIDCEVIDGCEAKIGIKAEDQPVHYHRQGVTYLFKRELVCSLLAPFLWFLKIFWVLEH